MNVLHRYVAVDAQVVERPCEVHARRYQTVNARVLSTHQCDDLPHGVLFYAQIEIEQLTVPPALGLQAAEAARGTVGARGLAREAQLPIPRGIRRRRNVQIGIGYV